MAVRKLDTFDISADAQSENLPTQLSASPYQTWAWEVTMTGSGSNEVYITPQLPLNSESPTETQVYKDLDSLANFRWMQVVTDEMVTAAGGTYREAFTVPNAHSKLRFDFDYQGGGSRVFSIVLRVG